MAISGPQHESLCCSVSGLGWRGAGRGCRRPDLGCFLARGERHTGNGGGLTVRDWLIRRGEGVLEASAGQTPLKTPLVPLAPKSDLNWNTSRPNRRPRPRRTPVRPSASSVPLARPDEHPAFSDVRCRPSERRAAALESSAHSKAMKPAASKTWRDRRADVWSSHPAAGMEGPYAGKTWGDRRADVDSCGPAKPMQTTAPSKTWRHWRADMGNSDAGAMETSGPTKAMKTPAASKTGRDRRADVWSSHPAAGMEGPSPAKPGETGAPMWGAPAP